MGAVTNMLFPQIEPHRASVVFTAILFVLMVFLPYRPIAAVMKYLCLSLLLYLLVPFWTRPDLADVLRNTLAPTIRFERDYLLVLVAILGTTISPYLFFWQTSMEVEETEGLKNTVVVDKKLITQMRVDVDMGMFLTCLVFFFIILSTGSTLFPAGLHRIDTVEEAAQALRPIAGNGAYALFALGILGTGMLSIPVLAGAVSYVVAESFGWKEGLNKRWHEAPGYYAVMSAALVLGLVFDFLGVSTIEALFWAAVLYGLTAPVLIGLLLHIANNRRVMGPFVNRRWSNVGGFAALLVMGAAAAALAYTAFF
jgi:Mn2+/Fe2+ NRAMP family transporter